MINYRLVQDHSSNPRKSGKWYAKAVIGQTVSTDVIAERIEKKCSCTISDVKAVLEALTEDKFEVQKHIKGLHLIYQPEKTKQASGKYEKKFLSGARLQRYKEFNNAEESGGGEG